MAYSETAIHQITEVLSKTLANTYLLALKTKNFHWNVKGSNFHSLHLLFDEQNGALVATADEVAERIRAFNKPVIGTMTEFLKAATLKESPANYPDAPTMIAALVADHEHIIEALLADIEVLTSLSDVGSADMLTGQLQEHEKMAWMLRSHLQ